MKIMPNLKTLGIAGMFMLGSGIFTSCRESKPCYDITVTTEHYNPIPAKIEDGCSYETENKKFIMSNGKLFCFDKKTKTVQKTDTMNLWLNEFEDFKEIAKFRNEHGDTLCLTANDIEAAKKWRPEWCHETDNIEEGKGIRKSVKDIRFHPGIFKYDDTSCNPHKW